MGLGGFHIGKSINAECVFASELNKELRNLYEKNFGIECQGDITKIDEKDIHDVLCAGFPCQSFSKAGKQKGLNDFILENVPNFKTHDNGKTWEITCNLLKDCNYFIQDFILSPHHFGIPHKRERVFIIGKHRKSSTIPLDFSSEIQQGNINKLKINDFLEPNKKTDKRLSDKQLKHLGTWKKFISDLPKDQPLPKFPIWAMEFGATYPLDSKCPYCMSEQELAKYKGAFGQSLKGLSKKEQLKKLPNYATRKQKKFPKWKINYIQKNRNFWEANKTFIEPLIPEIKTHINSWQKLEWNAGDVDRNIFKYLLQFRSSGIRVKNYESVSSLVLTGTQTPVIAWQKRYLNLKEAQKLQGFENISIRLNSETQSFRALGNAVNTKVVSEIIKKIFIQEVPIHINKKRDVRIPVFSHSIHH